MIRILVLAVVLLPTLAHGAECTLNNAQYSQVDGSWRLNFLPVPVSAASNQTAAFRLEFPNSGLLVDGAVYRPNGFGNPIYILDGPCGPDSAARCAFVEGASPTIYAGTADGITLLDDETEGAAAPPQVLLPELSVSMWYSNYRSDEFVDSVGGDVFALVGCD